MTNNVNQLNIFTDVATFNKEVIKTEQPEDLVLLTKARLDFAIGVLHEEIEEFELAHEPPGSVSDACDAMIDLIYYAVGRMYEMGVTDTQFTTMWNRVHEANMKKQKGNKGRGSDTDAIKPKGWEAPDLTIDKDVLKEAISTTVELMIPSPFIEAAALRQSKGEDYRSGTVQMKDYFPFGLRSYQTMIHTKSLRLVSLIQSGKEPNNESIRDTLIDLLNYVCFTVEAIDKGEV